MQRQRKIFWAKAVAVVGAIPIVLWAYEYGPDPGYVAVPGEHAGATCATTGCHTGTTNDPKNSGSVTVNFPAGPVYSPGVKQHLSVTIADPAPTQKGWGFELTARNASSPSTMAGTVAATDANTQLLCSNPNLLIFGTPPSGGCPGNEPLEYIEHSLTGFNATIGPGSGTFQFDWTPPATNVGNITIYVAGNAGVGQPPSQNGDHIYARTYTITPSTGGGPTPTIGEVDNAFSNIPNSPIQSGTWVAIKGTNLSNTNPGRGWNSNESFPTSMDGTSVTINGKTAFMYFISPTQVNVQAPTDAALGPVSVVVNNNGAVSASATATYQTNSPALLQWGGGQYPYALITDGATYIGKASVITGTVSAHAGENLTLWVTGLGATNPAFPAGQQPGVPLPTLVTNPTVTVGGVNVPVQAAVLRYAGLYQVNVQLPASVPTGDQAIKITQGSFQSPGGILINIQ